MVDETTIFKVVLTEIGEQKYQAALLPNGEPLQLSEIAIDSGNGTDYEPDRLQTELINEEYRGQINFLGPDPFDETKLAVTLVIPAVISGKPEGFWCVGAGIFDTDGDLIAVANIPPVFKPGSAQNAARPQKITLKLAATSSEHVTLLVEQNSVLATHEYVDLRFDQLLGQVQETRVIMGENYCSINKWADLVSDGNWEAAIEAALNSDYFTILFEAETYYHDNCTFSKNKRLLGAGAGQTIIRWRPENYINSPGVMFTRTGDVDFLEVEGITFIGNRPYQTTSSVTGQDMVCWSVRGGSLRNVNFHGCEFFDFGDLAGVGGAAIFLGSLTGTDKFLENVKIERCLFRDISNVPGIYINADGAHYTHSRNIDVVNNMFIQTVVGARQNCIYVLGPSRTNPMYDLNIDNNFFEIHEEIDCCIEVNHASGYDVSKNTMLLVNNGVATGILLRETSDNGDIVSNRILDIGTGVAVGTAAISVVRHTSQGKQSYATVNKNIIAGYKQAINLSSGTEYVDIEANQIIGKEDAVSEALAVAGVKNVRYRDNYIRRCEYVATIFSCDGLTIEDNVLEEIGDGAVAAIVDTAANPAIVGLIIRHNEVVSIVPGTPNFISVSPATKTRNRIEQNYLPAGFNLIPAEKAIKFDVVSKPNRSGTVLAADVYRFEQGSLSMSDGEGFTIGANLDASNPVCTFGDTVTVAFSDTLNGVTVGQPYVHATGQLRVRVQNETGAAVTLPAGTWTFTVIRTSEM